MFLSFVSKAVLYTVLYTYTGLYYFITNTKIDDHKNHEIINEKNKT